MRPCLSVLLLGLLALAACTTGDEKPLPDLRAAVAASSTHKTLLAAIRQGGVLGILESPGPYTLFAPTDAAFAALPPGIERKLFAPENKDHLAQVLRYHLVSGRLTSADLAGKISTPVTLEGGRLQIDGIGPTIEVGDAKIVKPDVEASNGVIHVIDAVLLPHDGVTPAARGEQLPVLEKQMAIDLLPAMQVSHGWISDKPEGFAVTADGRIFAGTDNDGVDDASGETLLMLLGTKDATF